MQKIIRLIMGLPEPTLKPEQAQGAGHPALTQPSEPTRPRNPWEAAGRELARAQLQTAALPVPESAAASGAALGQGAPWTPHEEKSGLRFAQRFGRGVLWAVVGLAAFTGLRFWLSPPKLHLPPSPPAKTAPAYPAADAQATAALLARAYLGWDETNPQARATALASLLPAGADTTMGWDGHGHQDVLDVQPASVTPGDQGQARVRVLALVRAAAQGASAPAAQWIALEVPVAQTTTGRIVVTGEPGIVGLPTQAPTAPRITVAETDPALSSTTQPIVDTFFKSYATGSTSTATAPGASIPPLPTGFVYHGLTSWSLDTGSSDTRTGTARVTWTLAGATVEQTYRVELTRVSSASAQTWQVASVHGGQL